MEIDEFKNKIDQIYKKIKKNLIYFYNKDGSNYPIKFLNWVEEVTTKNIIIDKNKDKKDKEMARRRRSNVYWIDFGINVGSEFNEPHFCVVIKECKYTAIVVPISSVKDNTPNWKESEDLIIEIGYIENLPREKKPCYAMINQIRTVSKQRLSDYRDNGRYVKLKLTSPQMDMIDKGIMSLCKLKPQEKN